MLVTRNMGAICFGYFAMFDQDWRHADACFFGTTGQQVWRAWWYRWLWRTWMGTKKKHEIMLWKLNRATLDANMPTVGIWFQDLELQVCLGGRRCPISVRWVPIRWRFFPCVMGSPTSNYTTNRRNAVHRMKVANYRKLHIFDISRFSRFPAISM